MLTWAVCWLHTKIDDRDGLGLWIIAAIIGDGTVAWAVATAITGK